jgi:hypothetical protein
LPTEDPLREFMARARTIDLIQLSKEKGFRDNLMEIQKSYGSVLAYVKLLMREADFARSCDSNDEGGVISIVPLMRACAIRNMSKAPPSVSVRGSPTREEPRSASRAFQA